MKVIDKTPLQNEKGVISPLERVQGTLKYGFSWYPELEAQKVVIAQLDRALEKGFTLIRNLTLPGSEIVEPIILMGPPGVYVIYVTHLSGLYEAKGDQWNTVNNGRSSPASINLMSRAARLARVLQVYLDRQGISLPAPVEPVLMASSPAMHIESMRPVVRVVMGDAVKQFAASLLQARPLLRSEFVYDLAERIITPRPRAQAASQAPAGPFAAPEAESLSPSRAQAIFRASEEAKPFDPTDLSFAFNDTASKPEEGVPQNLREISPARPLQSAPKPAPNRVLGMTTPQLAFLAGLFICWLCGLAGFAYLISLGNR
jgi:hypothetical protein